MVDKLVHSQVSFREADVLLEWFVGDPTSLARDNMYRGAKKTLA